MESANNPYAAGGGGWSFETLVAVKYAATMIGGATCDLGGRVERLSRQTSTPGFDDIGLIFEPKPGMPRRIDIQCRSRQPFSGNNIKFQGLLAHAIALVRDDDFVSGDRALAVVVGASSPAHREMADLCDLARTTTDLPSFIESIKRRKGATARRWEHVMTASGLASRKDTFAALRSLHVRMADIEGAIGPGRLQLLKDMGRFWTPPEEDRASTLFEALYLRMADLGCEAGTVDARGLRGSLGNAAPPLDYKATRHEFLIRLLHANEDEVKHSLFALGVDETHLDELSRDTLSKDPSITIKNATTLLVGPIGIGKSTELRRHYRIALRTAIENAASPIPVFLRAQQFRLGEIEQVAIREAEYIGDPRRLGIQLFVDSLDETGYEIDEVLPEFRALIAKMPSSTIIAASRLSPSDYRGETTLVPQLSDDEASHLIRRLRPDGLVHVFGRKEKLDLLRRPLFAIEYALNGSHRRTEAQLIDGIGRRVSKNLALSTFNALVDLAVKSVDYDGRTVPENELFLTPPIARDLLRSRLVTNDGSGLRLQLAVLTEWFASFAILNDSNLLDRTTETALVAWRWRYVHAQALLQSTPAFADTLMNQLTLRSPTSAAWVVDEVSNVPTVHEKYDTAGVSASDVKNRLIRADSAWFRVLNNIHTTDHLSNPTVESQVHIKEGMIAVASRYVTDPPLPENGDRNSGGWLHQFRRVRTGRYESTGRWPWEWCLKDARANLDAWLSSGVGLQHIESAQPELAFDYALTMVDQNQFTRPDKVEVSELENIIAGYRVHVPQGEVRISRGSRKWSLADGERFVANLRERDQQVILNPWPSIDRSGGWTWSLWSEEALKLRLEMISREALNIYKGLVEGAIPELAGLLSTYVLLPGKIVGSFTTAKPDQGFSGAPQTSWYISPQAKGAPNSSEWTLKDEVNSWDNVTWAENDKKLKAARGSVASAVSFSLYGGLDEVYSSRPASSLALKLLSSDLKRLKWSDSSRIGDALPALAPEITL